MKNLSRILKSLCMSLLLVLLLAVTAFAADSQKETEKKKTPAPVPAAVNDLQVNLSGTTAILKWSKVSNASTYKVYLVDKSTHKTKKLLADNLKKKTFKVKNLKQALTYSFMVKGVSKDGKAGPIGKIKSVTVPAPKPNAPKNFDYTSTTATHVRLKWDRVSNVDGYTVFVKKQGEKAFSPAKSFGKYESKCSLGKYPTDSTYYFHIKSYRKVNGVKVYSKASNQIEVKLSALASKLKNVRAPRYRVVAQRTLVGKDKKTGKRVTIKSGTRFSVNSRAARNVTAYLSNGQVVLLSRSGLSYRSLDCNPKNDYSKDLKELYVNSRNYTSRTDWFIWVSEYKLKTNIFQGSRGKWKLVKEFPCVVGAFGTRTTPGMHRILKKSYYGKYGSPIFWFTAGPEGTIYDPAGCAFHQYIDSKRSVAGSHGCVRLDTSALYYMYNRIPVGTAVYVH